MVAAEISGVQSNIRSKIKMIKITTKCSTKFCLLKCFFYYIDPSTVSPSTCGSILFTHTSIPRRLPTTLEKNKLGLIHLNE